MRTGRSQQLDGLAKAKPWCLCLSLCWLATATSMAGPPPVITAQPLDQSVALGGTATFSVTASSGTALSYQWYKDGLLNLDTMLAGQTSSNLTLVNVGLLDPGTYYVEVKNAGGTVTSRHASLTVGLLNSPPVADNNSYTTLEDVPLAVTSLGVLSNDTDPNGNTLTAVLVTTVTHGSLSLNPNGGFIYTPNTNYSGTDSFTYAAHDGSGTGNVATVSLNISPVDDPPITVNDSDSVLEDETVNIRVLSNDSDLEGLALTITGAFTTNGTTVVNNGGNARVRYTPAPDYCGTVVFSYTISDGMLSSTGSVTVTVTPVNDAPVANNDTYTTPEDMTLIVPVAGMLSNGTLGAGVLANDTDVEGDTLTAVIVSPASHGTLSLNPNGSFTYMPEADFNGTDSFTYRAVDGFSTGNVATVTINVTPVSDPLRITSQRMTTGGFELQVAGDAAPYVISASSSLLNWTPIFTNAAPSGVLAYTDTTAQNYPSRFYRVDVR